MQAGNEEILVLLATNLDLYYEQLISMHWNQLRTFVLRRGESFQDAEDIVQEAFVRAYFALTRYSQEQILTLKVRSWLFKVTWSVYCNYINRSKEPPSVPLDTSDDIQMDWEDEKETQPEVIFEKMERRQELEALVATLPQHYRIIVSMYFFDELSYQEIAEILNQPLGTVKVYVHRGVRLLRKTLEKQMNQVG